MTEDNWTVGGGHTRQYADHVLLKCTLETYTILLTNVTPQKVTQKVTIPFYLYKGKKHKR